MWIAMTDWQRLEQVIRWTGLSTNAFALGIGLKRSENLYQIKRGNNGISKELAELITQKYPTVNRAWLLTGDGAPFVTSGVAPPRPASSPGAPDSGIPYYNIEIAQLLSPRTLSGAIPLYYISVPSLGECDFAATTHGDAMAPDIPPGAIIAMRLIPPDRMIPGEVYMVVTRDFVALRYVRNNPGDPSELLLTPANRSSYDEMTLPRHAVLKLYLVKGIIINKAL